MYADRVTDSMKKSISESSRRRAIQVEFNKKNKITPRSIEKAIKEGIEDIVGAESFVRELTGEEKEDYEIHEYLAGLEYEMELAARNLQFEQAALLRDKINALKEKTLKKKE
jgi:excinuclease ABC subunit B